MPQHREIKVLPYAPEQIFDLIIEFEKYPEFLPWCVAARTTADGPGYKEGELAIGYKLVRETFSTRLTFQRPNRIDMTYAHGPLKHLNSYWQLDKVEGGCQVEFYVDFEFKSSFFQRIIEAKFTDALYQMIGAFEAEAHRRFS